jgi:hypothetical protein
MRREGDCRSHATVRRYMRTDLDIVAVIDSGPMIVQMWAALGIVFTLAAFARTTMARAAPPPRENHNGC